MTTVQQLNELQLSENSKAHAVGGGNANMAIVLLNKLLPLLPQLITIVAQHQAMQTPTFKSKLIVLCHKKPHQTELARKSET